MLIEFLLRAIIQLSSLCNRLQNMPHTDDRQLFDSAPEYLTLSAGQRPRAWNTAAN
jgi:hypothetical protein